MNDATQARNAARDGRRDERDALATRYASRRAHCHTEASRDEEDQTLLDDHEEETFDARSSFDLPDSTT